MRPPARSRRPEFPADLAVGLVGAALVVPAEAWMLRAGGAPTIAVTVALLFGLGLAIGLAIAPTEWIARRLGPRAWPRAFVRALPSLLVTIPVARGLFDGAFASTLPGAAYGPIWVPALVYLGAVPLLRVGEAVTRVRGHRAFVGIVLAFATFATELVNRNVQRSEYPDLHTALLVATCLGAGLAVRLLVGAVLRRRPVGLVVVAPLVLAAIAGGALPLALQLGLRDADARWIVATEGMHTRMLVRLARIVVDRDRDGHSPVLGGSDCDDADAAINPDAAEVTGNDVDENCDGFVGDDAQVQEMVLAQQVRRAELDRWRDGAAATELVGRTRGMNIVLVAVDTLRADALTDDARNRADFPNLFALLDESRRFRFTFAPAAGTDLSMSGVLTGQIDPYTTEAPTLAEALQTQGRTTHAVIPSEVIRYVGKAMLTRGLSDHDRLVNDRYARDVGSYTTSARTTELGLQFVDRHATQRPDAPFFLWVHYFDVHEHHEVKLSSLRDVLGDVGEPAKPDKYRLLVRVVDAQIGVFLAGLRERGLLDRTIVVLVSDHGEGLGEDPRLPENHGRFVYNPLVHVPMAFRIPGVKAGVVDTPVSLLDVYPTLLALVDAPQPTVDGTSLLPHFVDGTPAALLDAARPLPLNETDQFGVVLWPYKLMVRRDDNLVELYDLASDFGEHHDLSASDRDRVGELLSAYAALSPVAIDRSSKGRRARDRVAAAAAEELD